MNIIQGIVMIFVSMCVLVSCTSTTGSTSFCRLYQPVYMSHEDTEETKKQIDSNNAVWIELCEN